MDKRSDRGKTTREHIVSVATRLFTENGYEGTSIELVLQACGISRGALYHHYANKEALFNEVLVSVEKQVAMKVGEAAQGTSNPLDALRAGTGAWLALARDPTVRQIVLIDAPSVVGWQAWREIDNQHALGLLKMALQMAASAGRMRPDRVEVYAHMLLAVLIEMSLMIARSDDAITAIEIGKEAVEQLLSRLAGVEPNGSW
jgi:AcrR family transcriptional regulator